MTIVKSNGAALDGQLQREERVYELRVIRDNAHLALVDREEVRTWGLYEPEADYYSDVSLKVLASAGPLGKAAHAEIEGSLRCAMEWAANHYEPEKGSEVNFAHSIGSLALRQFREDYRPRRLREELEDQVARDRAEQSQEELSAYLAEVSAKMRMKLSKGFRRLWAQPDRLIEDTVLLLLENVRSKRGFSAYERAGRPAYLRVLDIARDKRRRGAKKIQLVEKAAASRDLAGSRDPGPQHHLLQRERQRLMALTLTELGTRISPIQKSWITAFRKAAEGDSDAIAAEGARRLGRNQSCASRAMDVMERHRHALDLTCLRDPDEDEN